MTRVRVDRDRCAGAGMCALTEPAVFDQSEEDGLVVLLTAALTPQTRRTAAEAVDLCPTGALSLDDGPRPT